MLIGTLQEKPLSVWAVAGSQYHHQYHVLDEVQFGIKNYFRADCFEIYILCFQCLFVANYMTVTNINTLK